MVVKPEIFAWQKSGSFCVALTLFLFDLTLLGIMIILTLLSQQDISNVVPKVQ